MSNFLTGSLIIAAPRLSEGMFFRSVCLVVHHDQDGAIGLMLNRPLAPDIPQLWQLLYGDTTPPPQPSDLPVHFGGPIAGPVMALHDQQQLAEAQTGNGIYVAAQRDHLQELLGKSHECVRLIVGHAGWSGGQLEKELADGYWYTLPATPEYVFEADDAMWSDLLAKGAALQLASWVKAKPIPDPSWN
jgi:putative transcriptional regulator